MPTRRSCCRSFPLLSSRECLPVHDCYYHHHYHHHHYCYHYYYCYYFIFSLISFQLSHLQIFRFAILREKKGNSLYKAYRMKWWSALLESFIRSQKYLALHKSQTSDIKMLLPEIKHSAPLLTVSFYPLIVRHADSSN